MPRSQAYYQRDAATLKRSQYHTRKTYDPVSQKHVITCRFSFKALISRHQPSIITLLLGFEFLSVPEFKMRSLISGS